MIDGILHNKALRNQQSDEFPNQAWNFILKSLKLLDIKEDQTQYLRHRWVLGAHEWMAGKHCSLQNLKGIFAYSDEEWDYIWSTMMQDGAWNVPGILDDRGNEVKANYAPEIMINFIAHDLRCHIVVVDLLIGSVQFCSANYLKENNVIFDAPLILYATGNHFQSVLPFDKGAFVQLANNLENESKGIFVSEDTDTVEEHKTETELTVNAVQLQKKT